ncbi:hypothetical protein [Paraburkholderia caballeronis]|uniref:hypothetical protein n=1 Tax=Paraburkholderia caballeronis TaxID=416943 RepID=UPI001064C338|nr:hypothetical protein [Paraburkholderia caballeronis]TDV04703.1 hypothetical protein C7408_13165 [Paraburkholderia caballeronis]TDV07946.1 hypothetical protein C7406_13365 [Paraburkholderia caballeronis]TDV18237.1 hypothetical protein C7404_13165 [Paraburkholderia caballeronis]
MPQITRNSRFVESEPPSDEAWLEQHKGDYPADMWLAARDHQVLAQAPDIDELIRSLKRERVELSDVAIIFNESGPV